MFAAEPIRKGEVVWQFDPRIDIVIPEANLSDLPPHIIRLIHVRAEYYPNQQVFVLSADGDAFMNHSYQANLVNTGTTAVANVDIAVGDELTLDYRQIHTFVFRPDKDPASEA